MTPSQSPSSAGLSDEARSALLEHGWCVVPDVLTGARAAEILERLWQAAREYRRRGNDTHIATLDPNASNVRVFELLELDAAFRELIQHPLALELVRTLLGPDFLISNFTANIARPGSGSMSLHSDQALVVPEPWLQPWSINVIWCLTDVCFENGATLFIPGSHEVTRLAELGDEPLARLRPFEAKAGSVIAMDGRIWHTSGANITADQDRALLFGYYSRSFLRGQVNWNASLSADVQAGLSPALRVLLGLAPSANVSVGRALLDADIGHH
ncbi:MAG: phytanoyl-CoA dioxygenase family protein [Burkholderiaceae bacterium]